MTNRCILGVAILCTAEALAAKKFCERFSDAREVGKGDIAPSFSGRRRRRRRRSQIGRAIGGGKRMRMRCRIG